MYIDRTLKVSVLHKTLPDTSCVQIYNESVSRRSDEFSESSYRHQHGP